LDKLSIFSILGVLILSGMLYKTKGEIKDLRKTNQEICIRIGGQFQSIGGSCLFNSASVSQITEKPTETSVPKELSSLKLEELRDLIQQVKIVNEFFRLESLPKGAVGVAAYIENERGMECASTWGLAYCSRGIGYCSLGNLELMRKNQLRNGKKTDIYICYIPAVKLEIESNGKASISIPKKMILRLLGSPKLQGQFKATCSTSNSGLRCSSVASDSLLFQLGLRSGDVICGISGLGNLGLTTEKVTESILYSEKTQSTPEICIIRNGKKMSLKLNFL